LEKDYFEELQTLSAISAPLIDFTSSEVSPIRTNISPRRTSLSCPPAAKASPMPFIEAMAASLPVVATNVGGNSEAVKDGVSGFWSQRKILHSLPWPYASYSPADLKQRAMAQPEDL